MGAPVSVMLSLLKGQRRSTFTNGIDSLIDRRDLLTQRVGCFLAGGVATFCRFPACLAFALGDAVGRVAQPADEPPRTGRLVGYVDIRGVAVFVLSEHVGGLQVVCGFARSCLFLLGGASP